MMKIVGVLPPEAQARLRDAAAIADPVQRIAAIERAERWIEQNYPKLLKGKPMPIMLLDVRLAFSQHLFRAGTVDGEGEPAHSCVFLFPPHHPAVELVKAAQREAATAKWGDKADAIMQELAMADKLALHDGNRKASYDGFPGNLYLSARSKTRPLIIDSNRAPLEEADGRVYAGCYVNAQVEIWAQQNQYGKRLNTQVMGVQFFRDGDAFGGGRASNPDDFADVSAGAGAAPMAAGGGAGALV